MKTLVFSFCLTIVAIGAACADPTPSPAATASAVSDTSLCGPYPKLYKEIIWNWMQKNLVDANSAKIEWEQEPKCVDMGSEDQHLYGWLVNFKVNSRNRFGAYTGKQSHGVLIKNGEVIKGIGFGY
jgi:hypothetical protein